MEGTPFLSLSLETSVKKADSHRATTDDLPRLSSRIFAYVKSDEIVTRHYGSGYGEDDSIGVEKLGNVEPAVE